MTIDSFNILSDGRAQPETVAPGAVLLHGFARSSEWPLLGDLHQVLGAASFRHTVTPGGHRMSVAMTGCGSAGWITNLSGYDWTDDPVSGVPWPTMPRTFLDLATSAARGAREHRQPRRPAGQGR